MESVTFGSSKAETTAGGKSARCFAISMKAAFAAISSAVCVSESNPTNLAREEVMMVSAARIGSRECFEMGLSIHATNRMER